MLLLSAHDFGGTTPRAARRRINIPALQSYRLWSLLSARQGKWAEKGTTGAFLHLLCVRKVSNFLFPLPSCPLLKFTFSMTKFHCKMEHYTAKK